MDLMKYWNPSLIGFFATLLAGLATFWASQLSKQKDAEKRAQEVTFYKELNAKNATLIEKTDEIARLNRELYKSVTGGEGYAELSIMIPKNGRALFELTNNTDYPLFDVTAQIYEPAKMLAQRAANKTHDFIQLEAMYSNATTVIDVGTLRAHTMTNLLPEYVLPTEAEEVNLSIVVLARNGSVKHMLLFKKNTSGVWNGGYVSIGSKSERLKISDPDNILPDNWKKAPVSK